MTEYIGPEVAQTVFKPVVDISDSKKNEDAVVLKTAGSFGSTEFTLDELVEIYRGINEFLTEKGLDPENEIKVSQGFDKGFLETAVGTLGSSLRPGESMSINGINVPNPNN